ncbi:hypothetical protein [Plantactinospora soyae]|uniref:Uncharacterized protein n=1 Tax=Plantactinospora soyae TaxID=1544732 RepID=A0A927MCM3_9ACTN|nr:hypothetical protein [Plantactinospora soyae]MBE1488635.1 hypothetical protein [Plantactinospora soyae]
MAMTIGDAVPPRQTPAPPRRRRVIAVIGPLAAGVILGAGGMWLAGDRHVARTERLVGTVTWSNEQTRLIAFQVDGERRDPLKGDVIYSIVAENWQDAEGTIHADSTYPTCLAGVAEDPVSNDHHRVELDVLHRSTGGPQLQHIALQVHCLD